MLLQQSPFRGEDEDEIYLEVRHVIQAPVNATVLRTCKSLYSNGMDIPYGKNGVSFNMVDTVWRESPPFLFHRDELHHPHPGRPNSSLCETEVNSSIHLIQRRVAPQYLLGYAYCVHFVRFIHFIGPSNAACTKPLEFSGTVKLHRCGEKSCELTIQNFLTSMRFYTSSINELCTSLETLVLHAREDAMVRHKIEPLKQMCECSSLGLIK